jgi:uncharacterized protein
METKESVSYNLKHLRQLVLEVTEICNLNCEYCGLSKLYATHEDRKEKNLSFKKAKMIIDYLFSIRESTPGVNYPLTISFYGGEPLINIKLIKEVVNYLKNPRFTKVNYGMTTNATLLNEHMDFLVSNNFNLVFSLDGNEIGQSYRVYHSGKNSFQRVFKNIKLFQKKYPEYFKKKVLFNSVLHNRNSVETIYNFIKSHFGKIPSIVSLNSVGIREDKKEEFIRMYKNVNESFISSGNCEAIEAEMFLRAPRILNLTQYIFKNSENVYNDFNDLIFDTSGMKISETGTCSPFSKKMFVSANGNILQCERIPRYFILGKILENRVQLDFYEIANSQNKYISKCKKQCDRCNFKDECPQCIYNIDGIITGSIKCSYFYYQFDPNRRKDEMYAYLRKHPHYYEKILKEAKITY